MLDLSLFETLDSEQIHWMTLAIAGVVIADGIIDNEERNVVKDILVHMESLEKAESMLAVLTAKKIPTLPKITIQDRSVAVEMLFTAIGVAIVDDHLSPTEAKYLMYVGAVLSFPKEFIEDCLDWAKEQTEMNRRRMRITQRGTTLNLYDPNLIGECSKKLDF